jgi:hypothetical protein
MRRQLAATTETSLMGAGKCDEWWCLWGVAARGQGYLGPSPGKVHWRETSFLDRLQIQTPSSCTCVMLS